MFLYTIGIILWCKHSSVSLRSNLNFLQFFEKYDFFSKFRNLGGNGARAQNSNFRKLLRWKFRINMNQLEEFSSNLMLCYVFGLIPLVVEWFLGSNFRTLRQGRSGKISTQTKNISGVFFKDTYTTFGNSSKAKIKNCSKLTTPND